MDTSLSPTVYRLRAVTGYPETTVPAQWLASTGAHPPGQPHLKREPLASQPRWPSGRAADAVRLGTRRRTPAHGNATALYEVRETPQDDAVADAARPRI